LSIHYQPFNIKNISSEYDRAFSGRLNFRDFHIDTAVFRSAQVYVLWPGSSWSD